MSGECGRGWCCVLVTLLFGDLFAAGLATADDCASVHLMIVGTVAPYYPPEAIHFRHEGIPFVHITVDVHGGLRDVQVLQNSGYPELDQATPAMRGLPIVLGISALSAKDAPAF